jgi:HEAT repeat protein
LTDSDAQLRKSCLKVIHRGADLLAYQVGDPVNPENLPSLDRKLTAGETAMVDSYRKTVEQERALLLPAAQALNGLTAPISKALSDNESAVGIEAAQALESMADARLVLLRKAASVPRAGGQKPDTSDDPLRPGLQNAIPSLTDQITHGPADIRLACLYVLETLETDAAPGVEGIVQALSDNNDYVRWAAARALGKMAPLAASKAVTGLAPLLQDANKDVRLTAAAALERFGPAAKSAVLPLVRAVERSDFDTQVMAIRALAAIGPEAAPAVPNLATALSAPETRVRCAAAKALGKLGTTARPARDALRRALDDTNREVRQAASDALLAIQ